MTDVLRDFEQDYLEKDCKLLDLETNDEVDDSSNRAEDEKPEETTKDECPTSLEIIIGYAEINIYSMFQKKKISVCSYFYTKGFPTYERNLELYYYVNS